MLYVHMNGNVAVAHDDDIRISHQKIGIANILLVIFAGDSLVPICGQMCEFLSLKGFFQLRSRYLYLLSLRNHLMMRYQQLQYMDNESAR